MLKCRFSDQKEIERNRNYFTRYLKYSKVQTRKQMSRRLIRDPFLEKEISRFYFPAKLIDRSVLIEIWLPLDLNCNCIIYIFTRAILTKLRSVDSILVRFQEHIDIYTRHEQLCDWLVHNTKCSQMGLIKKANKTARTNKGRI
jgi:hypothetical protein